MLIVFMNWILYYKFIFNKCQIISKFLSDDLNFFQKQMKTHRIVAIHNIGTVFFFKKGRKIVPILSWIIISWWLMCNRWLLFRLCETIKCCGCVPLVPTNEHLPFLLSSKPITWPAFYCLWCQFPHTVLEFNIFYFTKIVVLFVCLFQG